MVTKKNAMVKNLTQSIRRSFGRYIAIVAIIALGAGLFTGLLMTKTDMVATGQQYMDRQNMFDLRAVTNYGWTEEYVEKIAALEGIADAEGVFYLDLIARAAEGREDAVYRFYAMPEKINALALRAGRMPQAPNECLADGYHGSLDILGETVTISGSNSDSSLDTLREKSFTIVGLVASPLYMDMNRGTTSVGSGSLTNYFFLPKEAFDAEYYTEINMTLKESGPIYSQKYADLVEAAIDSLEPQMTDLAQARRDEVKQEAEEAYADGWQEYLDGWQAFQEGRHEASDELRDAWEKLKEGEQEIARNRASLRSAAAQISSGRKTLKEKQAQLDDGKAQFAAQKPGALAQIEEARKQLDAAMAKVKPAYDLAAAAMPGLQKAVSALQSASNELSGRIAGIDARMAEMEKTDPAYLALAAEKANLERQLKASNGLITGLQNQIAKAQQAISGYEAVQAGYAQLEAQKAQLDAAEAQLAAGQSQIDEGRRQLEDSDRQVQQGWAKLHEAEEDLKKGWEEYEQGKLDLQKELDDAREELHKARQELRDAREDIDDLEDSKLYLLDRTSNPGYNNLESSSDIVAGVSRVMPVFFLLVASLVCITTMTRMIDEERTQIGTLKALGYGSAAIIGKYLAYSGTGAVLGCGLGVLAGSVVFPKILWKAYCIMLYIQPDVVLTVDWPLCLSVTVLYTAAMLFVTWYSCHKTLEEQPAELIRPKAPNAGKKILLEYLPFWHKIPFLEKVSLRNIFRYRQRLAMMLVGIGGCTALLLTGFGLRDSITNVVDYQFSQVAMYDMSVYFRSGMNADAQSAFAKKVEDSVEDLMFYHQSSVDVLFEDKTKEVYMISGGPELADFIRFHSEGSPLPVPGKDEVLLTVGAAKALGVHVGEQVKLRNPDMQTLTLTVSGIYDNHLYNYAVVSPETIEGQWGSPPEQQMAYLTAKDGADVHALGARISDMNKVLNIAVSEDIAQSVGSMMDALDLVVWVIVFCAGLLAVTVLYNLTNININERIREIATIKVLGFNAAETAAYVFKENLTLTVAGAILGLPLGKLLLTFVMSQIKIELVWFQAIAAPISFVFSIALTLFAAMAVNFIFYFKLQTINMAEALKSVE